MKQDNKAKPNKGKVSVEAPQDTCDLGHRRWKVQGEGLTVGLDVGDKISHYCVLNEEAEVGGRAVAVGAKDLRLFFADHHRTPAG